MDQMIYGNWATLLLPINEDDSISFEQLEEEIDYLISCQVNGIYSNGTAGEFFTLTRDEFIRTSRLLADKCGRAGMPFQIGASRQSCQEMADRVELARSFKPLAIQVILPDWFPLTNEEIVDFFDALSGCAGGIPFVLYNPPHAKRVLTYKDYRYLLPRIKNLAGIKLCDGDERWYEKMRDVLDATSVFVPGHHLVTGLAGGASGSYSNVACLCPRKSQQLFELARKDPDGALKLEQDIQAYMSAHIQPLISEQGHANFTIDKFMAVIGNYSSISARVRRPYRSVAGGDVQWYREELQRMAPFFVELEGAGRD